jgi:hypothetical protein
MMEKSIPLTTLSQILDLRLFIARAGEQDSLHWWDNHALTEQGQWALARLYPRYADHAGARLAIEAAAVVHAKTIGHRLAVTLFGLGADLDARVMRQLDLRCIDDEPLTIAPPIRSTSELQTLLSQTVELTDDDFAVVRSAVVNGQLAELGAVTEASVWSDELVTIIRRLAAAYTLSDFGHLVVPYYRLEG